MAKKKLSEEIRRQLDDEWLNLNPNTPIINPFERLKTEDPEEFYKRLTCLFLNPDYIYFVCKHVLNVELLPMQALILQEMWQRKFPMLVATRGFGKTWMTSLYCLLRALLMPGRKIVVVGAAFRQSKFLHEYMSNIWKNAPVLRDMCSADSGPRASVDMCRMIINNSVVTSLPIGDGCLSPDTLTTYENRFGTIIDSKDNTNRIWGNKKFRGVDYFIDNGVKPTKKITTKKGFEFECTHNHAMKVIRDGNIQWCRSDQMVIGDRILIDRSSRWHSGNFECSEDQAYSLGAMIGDGCWTSKYSLGFASKDPEIVNRLNSGLSETVGKSFDQVEKDPVHFKLHGMNYVSKFLNFWGLKEKCYTIDKELPPNILSAPQNAMTACIQGLFDTDGHVTSSTAKGGISVSVNFTNTSKNLVRQLQYILLHYGIISKVTSRQRKTWNRVYQLGIYGNNAVIFAEKIGFSLPRKQAELLKSISLKSRNMSFDEDIPISIDLVLSSIDRSSSVPEKFARSKLTKRKSLQRNLLKDLVQYCDNPDWFNLLDDSVFYDEIALIEDSESYTCDIHVPEDNEYCANGCFSHNSKIRGQRANDIVADEFGSHSREIFENVIAGFAAVSANPVENVKNFARQRAAERLGIDLNEYDERTTADTSNQIILSGTAYYDFNHFAEYWKKWRSIILTGGDEKLLSTNVFNGEPVPESFNWKDYSIIRIPVDLAPRKFMDEGQVARSKATVHNGIYLMEFAACEKGDTEIVTSKGLKAIIDVEVGDLVLTHKGRFRKVTRKTFRDYNGKISNLKSFGYYKNYEFTPEHPFWNCSDDFIKLEDMGSHLNMTCLNELSGIDSIDTTKICTNYVDRDDFIYPRSSQTKIDNETRNLIINRLKSGETYSSLAKEYGVSITCINTIKCDKRKPKNSIPKNIKLDYNFGLCVGYYASEGSIDADGKAVSFALDGHVDIKLSDFVDELSTALKSSIGLNPRIYKEKNVTNVNINSRVLGEVMKYICPGDCYSKLIDHEILFSNEEFLRGFIVGMFNGDGHKRNNLATLQLANKNLVYQVKLALSYFGINSSFLMPKRPKTSVIKGKNVNLSSVWRLNIYGSNFRTFMNIFYGKEYKNTKSNRSKVFCEKRVCKNEIIENTFVDYTGRVYNIEVEEDNSYSLPNATVHNCFTTDSQGFFKRSLIESCVGTDSKPIRIGDESIYFDPLLKGNKNRKYVMAVDPASEVDNFSIIILELHGTHRRIVHCWTTTRSDHTEKVAKGITKVNNFYSYCARKIRDLMKLFNIVHIAMDSQGGGYSVSEALHDLTQLEHGEIPIWPIIDPEKEAPTDDQSGLHILEMCQFANYEWYSEANHGLRKDLENKTILFPRFDPITIGLSIEEDSANNRLYDTLEDCVMEIEELKNELSMIEITQSVNGRERWDTPEVKVGVSKKKRLRKDRYSALIMANLSARKIDIEAKPSEYHSYGGFSSRSEGKKQEGATYEGPNWFTSKVNNLY